MANRVEELTELGIILGSATAYQSGADHMAQPVYNGPAATGFANDVPVSYFSRVATEYPDAELVADSE